MSTKECNRRFVFSLLNGPNWQTGLWMRSTLRFSPRLWWIESHRWVLTLSMWAEAAQGKTSWSRLTKPSIITSANFTSTNLYGRQTMYSGSLIERLSAPSRHRHLVSQVLNWVMKLDDKLLSFFPANRLGKGSQPQDITLAGGVRICWILALQHLNQAVLARMA